jgi:hypothetical protein
MISASGVNARGDPSTRRGPDLWRRRPGRRVKSAERPPRRRDICGLCGVLGAEVHWTEAGGPDAASGDLASRRTRWQDRRYRVGLANKVLRHYGLTLGDWNGHAFVLASWTGRHELVPHLAAMWPAAERLAGRRCDPLDPAVIAAVERA